MDLVVEPGKVPEEREIDGSLEAMQALVGGLIELVYPWVEPVALVCNDEAKLLGMPLNRGMYTPEGQLYDIISGTFFLCGVPSDGDELASLTEKQLEWYQRRFARPEAFLRLNGRLTVICG